MQHVLPALMEKFREGVIPMEKIVQKMCHNPAILFDIDKRGYLREGYYADLTAVATDRPWTVRQENILYKCGWSPFEGQQFHSRVLYTFVNGHPAFEQGRISDERHARRLTFDR